MAEMAAYQNQISTRLILKIHNLQFFYQSYHNVHNANDYTCTVSTCAMSTCTMSICTMYNQIFVPVSYA